jgi:hypothetical protein
MTSVQRRDLALHGRIVRRGQGGRMSRHEQYALTWRAVRTPRWSRIGTPFGVPPAASWN